MSLLFFSLSSHAKILVYEFGLVGDGDNHGIHVTQIACRNLVYTCESFYSEYVTEEDLVTVESDFSSGDVINMSFTFQKPSPPRSGPGNFGSDEGLSEAELWEKYYRDLEIFENESKVFEGVLSTNVNVLFILAAGNGFSYKGWPTLGVPVGENYKIYPALFNFDNNIKVAAVDDIKIDLKERTNYRIEDYSNFSIDNVDVAAPVEKTDAGLELEGTSFAAPYVSRLSKKLIEEFSLTSIEVKSVLLKSSFIENLVKTLEVSKNYVEDKENSILFKIQDSSVRRDRVALIQEIPDVMLVKSGGVLVEELAITCAKNYIESQKRTGIESSCLEAHKSVLDADEIRVDQLKNFWRLRAI